MKAVKNIPEPVKHILARSSLIRKLYLRKQILVKIPYAINIELTNRCNLKCWMCPHPKMKNLDVGDIDFTLFKKIVDDNANFAYEKTIFTLVGLGEPLMYPKLSNAIEYVKTKCPQSPIFFDTNGTLLNEKQSTILIKLLEEKDRLLISLNAGSRSTYEWFTRKDKYDLVVSNIKKFLAIRKKIGNGTKPKAIIQILETKKTESEIKEFKEFWKPLIGPNDSIYVRPLLNVGGKIDTDALRVREKKERYPCNSLWKTLSIDKEGNVYPCCEGFSSRENSDLLLGNIHEKSLMEIYSAKINEIRKKHLNSQWDDISVCSKCDSWSYHANIWFKNTKKFF